MIRIKKTTIQIGLEKPMKILHITDSHLPFYCESDTEDMIRQGKKRNEKRSVRNLNKLMKYAEKNCDIIVHSGDLIDFISKPCVEFAREFLKMIKFSLSQVITNIAVMTVQKRIWHTVGIALK